MEDKTTKKIKATKKATKNDQPTEKLEMMKILHPPLGLLYPTSQEPSTYFRGRVNESEPWVPENLQKSEYICGLSLQFVEAKRIAAKEVLVKGVAAGMPPSDLLEQAVQVLGLEVVWGEESTWPDKLPLSTLKIPNTYPLLKEMGNSRDHAAGVMVQYLLLALVNPPIRK